MKMNCFCFETKKHVYFEKMQNQVVICVFPALQIPPFSTHHTGHSTTEFSSPSCQPSTKGLTLGTQPSRFVLVLLFSRHHLLSRFQPALPCCPFDAPSFFWQVWLAVLNQCFLSKSNLNSATQAHTHTFKGNFHICSAGLWKQYHWFSLISGIQLSKWKMSIEEFSCQMKASLKTCGFHI